MLTVECTHNFPNPTDRCSSENWCWPNECSSNEDVIRQRRHHVHMYRMPSNRLIQCHDVIAPVCVMSVIDKSFCLLFFFWFPLITDVTQVNPTRNCKTKQKVKIFISAKRQRALCAIRYYSNKNIEIDELKITRSAIYVFSNNNNNRYPTMRVRNMCNCVISI